MESIERKELLKLDLIQDLILQVVQEYAQRENVFGPLTEILGDYSNDFYLRAIKNVLFLKASGF